MDVNFITYLRMLKDQCISITKLRTKTKECLEGLNDESKYIFINNHPIAVLVDIAVYEELFLKPQLVELKKTEVSLRLSKQARRAKKSKKSDLINIQ